MENMGTSPGGVTNDVNSLLLEGFRAAKEGRREEAYQLFCDVVARDPSNEYGWLYRAATTDSRSEAYVCLEKVLSINPNNSKAQRGLERIREQQQEESGLGFAGDAGNPHSEQTSAQAEEADRVGTNEFVSGFNSNTPPGSSRNQNQESQGVQSAYPFPVDANPPAFAAQETTETSAFAGNDREAATRAIPADAYADYNRQMNTRPIDAENIPGFENENVVSAGDFKTAPFSDREESLKTASSFPAFNDQTEPHNNQPAAAVIGTGDSTNLDENGRDRQKKTRSFLWLPLVLLLLLAAVGIFLLLGNKKSDSTVGSVISDPANATASARAGALTTSRTSASAANGTTTSGTAASATGTRPSSSASTGANPAAGAATTAAQARTVVGQTTSATGTTAAPVLQTTAAATAVPTTAAATAAPAPTTAAPVKTTPASAPATAVPATSAPVPTETPAPSPTEAPAQPGAASPAQGNTAAPTKSILYTVQPGNNLIRISNQYGTSPDAIKSANRYTQPISGDTIFIGNKLIIPVSRPDFRGSGIIVGPGDTLDAVAAKFNTTPEAIIKLNGLAGPTDFKQGDPLLIP